MSGLMILFGLNKQKIISFVIDTKFEDIPLVVVVSKNHMTKVPIIISEKMRMSMSDDGDFIFYDERGIKFQDFRDSIYLNDYYSQQYIGRETLNIVRYFLNSEYVKFKLGILLNGSERRYRVKQPLKLGLTNKNIMWIESDVKDILKNSYYDLQLLDITNIKSIKSKINYDYWFNIKENELNYLKKIDYLKLPMNINPFSLQNLSFEGEYLDGSKFDINLENNFNKDEWIANKSLLESKE
uniref:Uncharacterized protein n=1 Tax=viral metagenome TaxID=1070528 RepID=A0A6C0ADJ4_9ZZZZ